MTVYEKANKFLVALLNVFEDCPNIAKKLDLKEFVRISKEESNEEDFTAMLMAMKSLFDPEDEIDLIDFTHVLNKLAVEHTMSENCISCREECSMLEDLVLADPTTTS